MNDTIANIFQPAAREVITSEAFSTYSMAEKYVLLQEKTGLDFSASIKVLEKLPIFLDGNEHKQCRKQMAVAIATSKKDQERDVRQMLDDIINNKFDQAGIVDLVSDFSLPLWRRISSLIVDGDREILGLVEAIPQLFYTTPSIRKRLEINARIETVLARPDWSEDQLIKMASAVLGARPFVGSLSLSLYGAIESHPGMRASEIAWPPEFQLSSLRYVDRVCQSPSVVEEKGVSPGERLRCVTQHPEYTSQLNAEGLYGYGAHVCLGKPIAQISWRAVTDAFAKLSCQLTPVGMEMEKYTDPFFMPVYARVQVVV